MAGYLPQNRGNKSAKRVGPTVSRKLRAAGWNISPSARKYLNEGIFVSAQGDHVSILVDLANDVRNAQVTSRIMDEIANWPQAGHIGSRHNEHHGSFRVTFTYGR